MPSRMFQGVVLQMKDSVGRMVGVVDAEGNVVACSELTCIGERWPEAIAAAVLVTVIGKALLHLMARMKKR